MLRGKLAGAALFMLSVLVYFGVCAGAAFALGFLIKNY